MTRIKANQQPQKSVNRISTGLSVFLLSLCAIQAHAEDSPNGFSVSIPNGYASLTVDDLKEKSIAGDVRWTRSWTGQEWKFNPYWETLSQSFSNMTGSQTLDTAGSTTATTGSSPTAAPQLADAGGGASGCWVWVDDDWQPTASGTVAGGSTGTPPAPPMVPLRTTPFNMTMGNTGDYVAPLNMSVDYVILCGGVSAGGAPSLQNSDAIRRINELYLGNDGRYVFSNHSILQKQTVQQLPQQSSSTWNSQLSTGTITIAPISNDKGFRWIDRSGSWIDYNTQGQVVSWGDKNNNTIWLVRDTDGTVRGVADSNGHVLYSIQYTGQLVTEVDDYPVAGLSSDLAARSIKYTYDSSNRLTSVTDVRGNTTTYAYDSQNHITKITDAEGRVEQISYTDQMVLQRTAPDGGVTDYEFSYDQVNKQLNSKITGPQTAAGRRTEQLTHNRVGQLIRQVVNGRTDKEVQYDTGARATISTNARGFTSKTIKNEYQQVVEIDQPDGTVIKKSYSPINLTLSEEIDELGNKTDYQYNTSGNLTKKIEAVGTADERTTDYEVNSLGQITKVTRRGRTESNGTITADAVWQVAYDSLGNINKVTDPEGNVRLYAYDRAGNLVSYTNPLGKTTQYIVDANGNLIKEIDALGRVRSYNYDKVGNLVKETDARLKVTQAAYDAMNRQTQIKNPVGGTYQLQYDGQGLPTTLTDEEGRTITSQFDTFLRLTKQIDGLGNTTSYSYTIPNGTGAGTLGSLQSPTETQYPTFTEDQRFDQQERLTSLTQLNTTSQGTEGLVDSATYDKRGNIKTQTDPNGKTSTYSYDALGQMTQLTDSLGNKTNTLYDVHGNFIQITDANGNANKFVFDRNDRVIQEILPLGQTTSYKYDAVGNLAQQVDANGNKAILTYDDANRLTTVKLYNASHTLVRTTSYTWDNEDNLSAWSDTDNSRNQTTSSTSTFDDDNRKTNETITYPSGYTLSYGYGYDLSGNKTQITWPDSTALTYSYSAHGQLQNVTIPNEGQISVNQFKWFEPVSTTLPGGTIQQRSLDGLMNLEGLKVTTPNQQTVLTIANTYGKLQELKTNARVDTVNNVSTTKNSSFTYDDENRLTQVTTDTGGLFGTDTENFTLDAVGNRIAHSRVNGAWTYDANNRLTQRGTGSNATTYRYDDAGNLLQQTQPNNKILNYSYDTLNRLTEVSDGNHQLIARYGYDPLDRRISKEQYRDKDDNALSQATRTYYLYAAEGLIAESQQYITLNADQSVTTTNDPVITTEYGLRTDSEFTTGVMFLKTLNSNGQPIFAYFHRDQQDSPVQATDKAGNLVWSATYNVFGQATITTPQATADQPTITNTLRLSGQTEDPETGLYYNYRRYYDPSTGRYITQDPIGLSGGINRYKYADANPAYYTDPTGECPMCLVVAAEFVECTAVCMATDAASNAITGECNNWGQSAKHCALECVTLGAIGRGLGALGRAFKSTSCGNSFTDETLVHVKPRNVKLLDAMLGKAELRPISQLKVGDEVLAQSDWEDAGKRAGKDARLSYEKITDIYTSHKEQILVHLTLSDGQTITATDGHPFKTTGGWRDAIVLKIGSKLLLKSDGSSTERTATVVQVSTEKKVVQVYNLEVANAHTYFVGQDGELVHNCLPKPPRGRGSVPPADRDPKRFFPKSDINKKLEDNGGKCIECGNPLDPKDAIGHHIDRHADGGRTDPPNLAPVCHDCHINIHRP